MVFHPAIFDAAHDEILQRLKRVQVEQQANIIYAIESRSRAWGFHSPDSTKFL